MTDAQREHYRGSIQDVERRLNTAKGALEAAIISLENSDPDGARYALDEAASGIETAGGEARTTSRAVATGGETS